MGLFGQSTPFDTDIDKATSETNTNENWSLILDVCDKLQSQPRNGKECLKVIMKRMGHADPHVVMQAITLLDACSNNCGKSFHLEIASREFENEFRRLLAKAQPKVSLKMRQLLKNWAENDYKNDPELNLIPSLYAKLRQEGLDFSNLNEKPTKSIAAKMAAAAAAKDPNVVSSQQEEDDIAKAIELSLKESGKGSPKQTSGGNGGSGGAGASSSSTAYPSLYPSFSGSGSMASITSTGGASNNSTSSLPEPRKVRALYDFEAVEENELTFFAGEIIHVLEDTDPNWWKGFTQRAEGLFPSNFVTADLSVDPERLDINQQNKSKKSVQFEDDAKELQQKTEAAAAAAANQRIEVDEAKVDRLLHLLHEANPEDPSQDSDEMLQLEQEVHQMGPLIDAELERVDRKHAQLTQLSSDLVDAINLYHSLMRDDRAAMMGGAGAFMPGMPGHGGYQGAPPNPQMLYGAAGYPGANAAFPQQQMIQSFGMPSMPYAANTGQQPITTNNSPMPSVSMAATVAPGGAYPPHSASNAQLAMGHTVQSQMTIPMQFQNGHVNSPHLNGGINALQQMATGPAPPPQQQQNYQMLPPQQQQQPQITSATTANQMPPIGQALISNNPLQQQQQQHQSTAPSHQQFTSLPPLQQQQQQHAPYMQQQQVPYAPMPNGPQAYMGVATQQATAGGLAAPGVMMQQPLPQHQHQQPQQLNHNHQNNGDQFSQLQQQMAAMSMGAGGVGGMTFGGGMNQQQNYLVQNETKNNIPIYQQQR